MAGSDCWGVMTSLTPLEITRLYKGYINFCLDNPIPTRTDIKILFKQKKRAFTSGNKKVLSGVQRNLRERIRVQLNYVNVVWRGLRTIL